MRWQREGATVEHQIAGNFADTARAQLAQQQPELFQRQPWIATAAQKKAAVEPAGYGQAVAQGSGAPGVGRAKQFEGGVGGDQFHRRRRVHRLLHVVADQWLFRIDPLYNDGDTALRNARLFQRSTYFGR